MEQFDQGVASLQVSVMFRVGSSSWQHFWSEVGRKEGGREGGGNEGREREGRSRVGERERGRRGVGWRKGGERKGKVAREGGKVSKWWNDVEKKTEQVS